MQTKTRITLTLDIEIERILRQQSRGNISNYTEKLIYKGLLSEVNEVYLDALNAQQKTILNQQAALEKNNEFFKDNFVKKEELAVKEDLVDRANKLFQSSYEQLNHTDMLLKALCYSVEGMEKENVFDILKNENKSNIPLTINNQQELLVCLLKHKGYSSEDIIKMIENLSQ